MRHVFAFQHGDPVQRNVDNEGLPSEYTKDEKLNERKTWIIFLPSYQENVVLWALKEDEIVKDCHIMVREHD
jgi:hypothetical protein